MSTSLAIIALEYLEPDYVQTLRCLAACQEQGIDVFFAKRDGVGNMSRAFNEAFTRHVAGRYDLVWFVTNVVFRAEGVPWGLARCLIDDPEMAAVHPCCPTSDHDHLRPGNDRSVTYVPFVELMAPMFRTSAFEAVMFEEELWYWYMDLVISHRLRKAGWRLGCFHSWKVEHTYLRNAAPHPITLVRKELREIMREPGQRWLTRTYGPDWRRALGWKG